MVNLYVVNALIVAAGLVRNVKAFSLAPFPARNSAINRLVLASSLSEDLQENDAAIQWNLMKKHHAKGSWKGIWTTYDYIGDVLDETVASVDLNLQDEDQSIEHAHTIVVGAKRADCATCFDSMETKTLPVATYTPENLRKSRLGACGLVNGPSLVRSGAMATELVLAHGDGRVRVIFQHAPVWEKGVEPGSCPPQGLKLFRAMVSREALRETVPTAETEKASPPTEGNPIFYRPVPPFNYFKKWAGTSWTWGPQTGNKGWALEELDEEDAWQGQTPVDRWNLRLPGGIHIQAPRVITGDFTGICRLAWLPDDETLLRLEAGVTALQPMVLEDDSLVGFAPPDLVSLRCDMLDKVGELENLSRPSRDLPKDDRDDKAEEDPVPEMKDAARQQEKQPDSPSPATASAKDSDRDDPEPAAIRDVLSL